MKRVLVRYPKIGQSRVMHCLVSYLLTGFMVSIGRSITATQLDGALLQKPRIIVSPTDQYSTDGVLEFVCRADGNPPPIIDWYNATDNQLVTERIPSAEILSGIHVNKHYGRLMISNPLRGLLYSFYCNASNSVGWTVSQGVVHGGAAYLDTSFRRIPLNQTVDEGQNVTLTCEPPAGLPKPNVFWMRGDQLMTSQKNITSPIMESESTRFRTLSPEGHLRISPVQLSDSGHYVCVARNIIGERRAPGADLIVKSSVTFVETPKHVRVRQGQTALFRCHVEGSQTVQWRRGSGEGTIDPTRMQFAQGQLIIHSVQTSDAGTYICSAPGTTGHSATLTVDTPPSFEQTPHDLSIHAGQIAWFHCVARGHPTPSIYWELPDKTPIFPLDSFTDKKHTVFANGSLKIDHVNANDEGKYQCTAHSSIDTIHSSAKLQVRQVTLHNFPESDHSLSNQVDSVSSSPKPHGSIPFINLPPCNQTRVVGESTLLMCDVGNRNTRELSRSRINWSTSWTRTVAGVEQTIDVTNPMDSNRYRLLPDGGLHIISLTSGDSGLYTCTVQSEHSESSTELTDPVHVKSHWTVGLWVLPRRAQPLFNDLCRDIALPPPRNLRATNITTTTLTLIWEAPQSHEHAGVVRSGPESVAYWVEYLSVTGKHSSWVTVERNWPLNTITLHGLRSGTIYYFLVRSRWMTRRVGWSSDPLGPVMTLHSTDMNSLNNHYHEEELTDLHKRIRNIQLEHVQFRHLLPEPHLHVEWTIAESATLLNAITGFRVRARSIDLLRCVASILGQTPTNSPSLEVISSSPKYCSFHYSDSKGLAGVIYRLESLQRLYSGFTSVEDTSGDIHKPVVVTTDIINARRKPLTQSAIGVQRYEGTVTNLRSFQCYEMRITAFVQHAVFGKLESPASLPQFVLTSERPPSAPPSQVSVTWAIRPTSRAHIHWSAPAVSDWNGLLTGYLVQIHTESSSLRNAQTINVTHSILNIEVDLPLRTEAYLVQVAAITCSGVGVLSQPVRLAPASYLPHGDFVVSNVQSNSDRPFELMTRPWFVGTMIGSIVAWCIIITLVAFFCCRKRYRKRKTQCAVASSNVTRTATTNFETQVNNGSWNDKLKLEPLLADNTCSVERENTMCTKMNHSCDQSQSYAEYLVYPGPQILTQANVRAKTNESSHGAGTPSLSSSGGLSSLDCQNQPTLISSPHRLSGKEMESVKATSPLIIPQSYMNLSPSQHGWSAVPGSYPSEKLPPFQANLQIPTAMHFKSLGPRFWQCSPRFTNPVDQSDGDNISLYHGSGDTVDYAPGATPYATASILATGQRQFSSPVRTGYYATKLPLSNMCTVGGLCYPCGNAQSSSDQASYTSNSEQLLIKRKQSRLGRFEQNTTIVCTNNYSPGQNITHSKSDVVSKMSCSPIDCSVSRSPSKQCEQPNKLSNPFTTALTATVTTTMTSVADADSKLTSNHATPHDNADDTDEDYDYSNKQKQNNGICPLLAKGGIANEYTPHSDASVAEWQSLSVRDPFVSSISYPNLQWIETDSCTDQHA